ncbi:MFS transporter [Sulfuracidifex tepidarius]|uniref:MFS transporter n=1 Tax=Sulfuracidifex tepidarius TaxID=1294262 RepID=UPI001C443A6A|nr:MFS transporter [Sulfuracidifex tepidarius]
MVLLNDSHRRGKRHPLLFAAGGEMNTIMVMNHEIMPNRHRSKTMYLEVNFINFGGLLLAAVALSSAYDSISFQRLMVGVTAIVILVVLAYARMKIPESIRWLEEKGDVEAAEREVAKYFKPGEEVPTGSVERMPSIPLRLVLSTTMAAANTIGFDLMTYVAGPYFFPQLTATIILVASIAEFLAGLGISPFADSLSRKVMLLLSFVGTAFTTAVIYFTIPYWSSDMILFWVLLIVLNFFTSVGCLTEDTLKGELWPTSRRGTYTAIVRFLSIGAYIPVIFLTSSLSIYQYMLFNMSVWTIGLVASLGVVPQRC